MLRPPVRSLRRAVALAVVALVGVAALAACQPSAPRPSLAALEGRVYRSSLDDFTSWWKRSHASVRGVSTLTVTSWFERTPHRLDEAAAERGIWDLTTDLCSWSPDRGPGFDFREACVRHDFAWRNLRRIEARGGGDVDHRASRLRATEQFGRDLQASCRRQPVLVQPACRSAAAVYLGVVRRVS